METFAGYIITEQVYTGKKSKVFRGQKENAKVIIKTLLNPNTDTEGNQRLKREFGLQKKLDLAGVVKAFAMVQYENSHALVFEDIGGESLDKIFQNNKVKLAEVLEIAIRCAEILGEVHDSHIIHKDIKPHNFIYNPFTKVLKLTDFGSASIFSKENPSIVMEKLEGTLAYISPEQTGRMNRSVDYRTDYYSLGVSFYQLLTGKLPFTFTEAIEMLHAHMAVIPISLESFGIPQILSAIVAKLMNKNVEDRYQSTGGLLYDLQQFQERISQTSILVKEDTIHFDLGKHDVSLRFAIPEKLYGREGEVQKLYEVYKQVTTGSNRLMLVSGVSGIGKTALVKEVYKPITDDRGYFVSGKFEPLKRDIPYSAIIDSFKGLINQILAENTETLAKWKVVLSEALGVNGKVVTEVLPELELIIGTQSEVVELGFVEAQNRFNTVFQAFVKCFAKEEHPLVIFLDDLQWSDTSSIHLIKILYTSYDIDYLFLILSYRINEVNAVHPFSLMLEGLKELGKEAEEIALMALSLQSVQQLVSETLSVHECSELAGLVYAKTGGNPLFVTTLLLELYRKSLIYRGAYEWQYNIKGIKEVGISDDVIELLLGRIDQIAIEEKAVLKFLSCIGNEFAIGVYHNSIGQVEWESILILSQLVNYGFLSQGGKKVSFVHDKIKEAAYGLLTEKEREKYHYQIGKYYLERVDTEKENLEDNVFIIVNQWNQGIGLMNGEEKSKLIDLNLLAGDKAMASAAYETALHLYRMVVALTIKNIWQEEYQRAFGIYTKLAKAEYLNGNSQEAEKYFEIILNNTKTEPEKAYVYEIKLPLYTAKFKFKEALETGLEALSLLGVLFSQEHDPTREFDQIFQRLARVSPEELLDLPLTDDTQTFAIMRLLVACMIPAYVSKPNIFPLIVARTVTVSLEYGISSLSPAGFAWFGSILSSRSLNYELGYRFGKLAMDLVDKHELFFLKSLVSFIFYNMINHWNNYPKEGFSILLEAYNYGVSFGDLQFASYTLNQLNYQRFWIRENLQELQIQLDRNYETLQKLNQFDASLQYNLIWQAVLNLLGESEDILLLDGERFDETAILPQMLATNNYMALFIFYTQKAMLHYLFGDTQQAYEYLDEKIDESSISGVMIIPESVFLNSLVCLALIGTEGDKHQVHFEKIAENQHRMKLWAENCPANYGHKYHIVVGELASIHNDIAGVIEHFNKAIALAQKYEFLFEEAIANELFAGFWEKQGNASLAKACRIEAHNAYQKWGCVPKCQQLQETYPYLERDQYQLAR
ncbi:MAG: serine/threonine-protein kinase PknK [Spirochaetota bacterium]